MTRALGHDTLVMFAKAPIPGRVKTRLGALLGDELAARLQAAFLEDLGARFGALGVEQVVAAAPDASHAAFAALEARGWRSVPQGEGDLGERLQRIVGDLQRAGARRVVVIGSDSPTLPAALVVEAFRALEEADVAVGPVFDGGYYLIGTRVARPEPFRAIPWGTDQVFATTLRRLEDAAISCHVLPFWYDVDDRTSLALLASHLGLPGPRGLFEAPSTQRVLESLEPGALGG
jgi:uncharacterized protein